jgi:hypothetical protein
VWSLGTSGPMYPGERVSARGSGGGDQEQIGALLDSDIIWNGGARMGVTLTGHSTPSVVAAPVALLLKSACLGMVVL